MTFHHAIVWMDSHHAEIFRFDAAHLDQRRITAHSPFRKLHHKAGVIGSGHQHLDHDFLDSIALALNDTREWLLVGPGLAKDELLAYLRKHQPTLVKTMVGVETMDHPTDGELMDHARRFFKTADKKLPNSPAFRG